MPLPVHLRDRRTRFMMVFGNLSLVAGLLLWNFARPHVPTHAWLDAFIGLFLGISISANLMAVYRSRRCRPAEPQS